jgi:hypothetical protein
MEKKASFKQSIFAVLLITICILMIPFVAMQFISEVNWSAADFLIMGLLLFGTGFMYVLLTRYSGNFIYRVAVGLLLGATLFMIWANLAVGLIGSGPHAGNLMYIAVVVVGIIGTVLSRFKPAGMGRTAFAMALIFVWLTVIALVTNMDEYPGSSVIEIIGVNAFFATLFVVAGLLFRYVRFEQMQKASNG